MGELAKYLMRVLESLLLLCKVQLSNKYEYKYKYKYKYKYLMRVSFSLESLLLLFAGSNFLTRATRDNFPRKLRWIDKPNRYIDDRHRFILCTYRPSSSEFRSYFLSPKILTFFRSRLVNIHKNVGHIQKDHRNQKFL